MDFTFNKKQAEEKAQESNFQPIPAGTYEVVIKNAQERSTKKGAVELQLDLVVRNDLDNVPELAETNAKYHNRHVFMDNWQTKATNDYNPEAIQRISLATNMPDGMPIKNVDDFVNWLKGKPMNAYIKLEDNEYEGKVTKVNRVSPFGLDITKFPTVNHDWNKQGGSNNSQLDFSNNHNINASPNANPFASNGSEQSIDVSDNDLPF